MPGAIDPRSDLHASARSARARLRSVPDADPQAVLGPQHEALSALIAAVTRLTPEQDASIESAWYDGRGPHRFTARGLASQVASANGRLEAQMNARQRTWAASAHKCRDAAGDAAHALAVRDLVGAEFTREAYDELMRPWVSVMGPAHPADGDRAGQASE